MLGEIEEIDNLGGESHAIADSKPLEEVVYEIILGVYGTGALRKRRITEMGLDYKEVQALVNRYIKVAHDVLAGKYGNGETRKKKIASVNLKYEYVQKIVNWLVGK